MKAKIIFATLFFSMALMAEPIQTIPEALYDDFTLQGQIPVAYWYLNNSYPPTDPIFWSREQINDLIVQAKKKTQKYYGKTDEYLYAILDKYAPAISGKSVAVLGSVTPWYESMILAYGGNPTTIEYNKILTNEPRINVMTVEEFRKNPRQFDLLISISSIEHDGLGRYGDPINPYGDFDAMNEMKGMLNEGGMLILAVPVGIDLLVWNAHRIYGPLRLSLLFNGWKLIDSSGFSENDFAISQENYTPQAHHQPVFVLSPIK